MVARGARAAAVVVLVLAWLVGPAAAQRNADAAEREYRLGYKALQAGDCATALAHYQRSLELAPRPRTLFNMAACQEELGLQADAWRSYHAFLELAEARDAEIVVKAKARIAALRGVLRGKLKIVSSPPGASVHVDGERQARGVTPLTLSLEPGDHEVRVTMRDAVPVERLVEVAPEEVVEVAVTLELPATIAIEADPVDAVIEPMGGGVSAVGRFEAAVAPGRHVFAVRRDGYVTERLEVDAVAGRSHVERVRLRPVPTRATLVVAGAPDAVISIDGEEARATTTTGGALELRELDVGAHAVVVTAAGRAAWRDTLHLAPGEIVTVELRDPRASSRRPLAWGLGGLGVAGLAGGGVVGVMALRDVVSPLPEDHDRGKRRALLADGLLVAGTVAVVVAWRWLRGSSPAARVSRTFEDGR